MRITVECDFFRASSWESWSPERYTEEVVVEVESSETIKDVKRKARGLLGSGEEGHCKAMWTFEDGYRLLASGQTLAECNVREGTLLHLGITRGDDVMEIFVLTQAGERIRRMVVSSNTVAYVKSELQIELEPMDPRADGQRQCLCFDGKELKDDRTLKEYGIEQGSCLHAVTRRSRRKPKLERPSKRYSLEVERSDTMDTVKAKIEYKIGILSDQHRLYHVDYFGTITEVEDGRTLESYRFSVFHRFSIRHLEDERSSVVEFRISWDRGQTWDLVVEFLPTLDPELKIKMLSEKIKWMILYMEQRRGCGGNVDEGGSKTFSSGSLDFRDNYIAIVLFDGSYVWIKSRDPAHKGVRVRSRVNRPDKYEPRFKPPREKTPSGMTQAFEYLSVGEYHTPEKAAAVWKMAAFYYGKHDGRLELADGTHFCVPPMSQALSGTEKKNWVTAKVKEVREEFWKELEASKNRPSVVPEGSSWGVEEEIMAALGEPLSSDQRTSSSEDRSDDDVAHGRTELPASSADTVASEIAFNTSQRNTIQQLSRQLTEQQQMNLRLSEQLQQSRQTNLQYSEQLQQSHHLILQLSEQLQQSRENKQRWNEGNAVLQQMNEELESVIRQTSSIYADFYLRSVEL